MPYWIEFSLGFALAALILLAAMYALFRQAWSWPWQLRRPLRPRVCIQGDLLIAPRRLAEARLPFEPAAQPRLRSGALLWASAATVTHTLADERDRQAILDAVQPLGFTPEKFLARCPILGEVQANGQRGYVVRDGNGYRAYFLGQPAPLLEACRFVWDQAERAKAPVDAAHLPGASEGLYALAMAPADDEGVGPLTYLGSLRIAAPLRDPAPVELLRAHGARLHITPSALAPEHSAALQALGSETQPPANALMIGQSSTDHCFVVESPDDPTWAQQVCRGFALAHRQRQLALRLMLLLALLGLSAVWWTLPWWCLPAGALMLLPLAILCAKHPVPQRPLSKRRVLCAGLWSMAAPLALHSFAAYAFPDVPALPIAFFAAAATLGLPCREAWGIAAVSALGLLFTGGSWLWLQPPVLPALFCLLGGLLHGLILRLLFGTESSRISDKCS